MAATQDSQRSQRQRTIDQWNPDSPAGVVGPSEIMLILMGPGGKGVGIRRINTADIRVPSDDRCIAEGGNCFPDGLIIAQGRELGRWHYVREKL